MPSDIKEQLRNNFLMQDFIENDQLSDGILQYRQMAKTYARVENSIAVLSDLRERVSYIYYGGIAQALGIGTAGECHAIHSIWEEKVFSLFTNAEMEKRHVDELRFLHFLKSVPRVRRQDYFLCSYLHATNPQKGLVGIKHRIFYVGYQSNGSVRLALCLYDMTTDKETHSSIINTVTGEKLLLQQYDCRGILSKREKAVLRLIDEGKLSKEISSTLSISIHTVNRHRQNILAKLNVANSIEACRIASALELL